MLKEILLKILSHITIFFLGKEMQKKDQLKKENKILKEYEKINNESDKNIVDKLRSGGL